MADDGMTGSLLVRRQRPTCKHELLHRSTSHEVLLDDPFEHRRVAVVVPGPFRIDDGDGSLLADAQAIGLGAVDPALL